MQHALASTAAPLPSAQQQQHVYANVDKDWKLKQVQVVFRYDLVIGHAGHDAAQCELHIQEVSLNLSQAWGPHPVDRQKLPLEGHAVGRMWLCL